MQSTIFGTALVVSAACALAACGTITRGTKEDVQVQTQPAGATVTTDIGMSCVGPCILKVARKQGFTATATAPGYLPAVAVVGTRVSGGGGAGLAGNILLGGVIGGGVDIASGSMYDHFPNPVVLILQPIDPNNPPAILPPAAAPSAAGPVVSMAAPEPPPPRYPMNR